MATKKEEEKKEKDIGLGDALRKIVSIGVGAAFMTEDTVRNALKDIPLPKEIMNGLLQNAKSAKTEFTDGVREEVRTYLSNVDPYKMVDDLVERYDISVNATFEFKKKEPSKDDEES